MANVVSQHPLNVIFLYPGGDESLWAFYSIVPWLELVLLGLVFGHWLEKDPQRAFSTAWKMGLALLLLFGVVRALDGFGNIRPRMSNSWIDFLNPVKYPPSMTFTLMTTGVNLLLLWLLSRVGLRVRPFLQPLAVFGQAPLLFYVLHLFLYAWMGRLVAPDGTSIPTMLSFWLLGLLMLFPACWWYARVKRRQPAGSILRLF
jgi:uncharacterized membrane protein